MAEPRRWPALDLAGPTVAEAPDQLLLCLDDHGVAGITEPAPSAWRVFFDQPALRDAAHAALARVFAPPGLTATPIEVLDEGWAERSQASLSAVRVGTLVVAPPWDAPPDLGRGAAVVIQPSMGFGTGHHASTRLCLAALQRLSLRGRSVLDVGTGSGVLALAARRLGASRVLGIDRDPDAIDAARRNLPFNPGIDEVSFRVADLEDPSMGAADVVVANLTGAMLVRHAATLSGLLAPAGDLVISGFMADEEAAVAAAFEPRLTGGGPHREENWTCLTLRAPADEP